jgi:hypothetical protein
VEKSIAQLINEQNKMQNVFGSAYEKETQEDKKKSGQLYLGFTEDCFENASAGESKKRRNRFKWNPDFDELAKDASIIIKARCRSGQRMDWSAVTQVFPVLGQNSVRQRMDNLTKDSPPTLKAYLQRLRGHLV